MELIPVITLALVAVLLVLVIILLARKPVQPPKTTDSGAISALGALGHAESARGPRSTGQPPCGDGAVVSGQLDRFEKRLHGFSVETSQQLDGIRAAVDGNLRELREDNNKKLDEMRGIVDEKLQKTLSDRMNESFRLVNERLEQVLPRSRRDADARTGRGRPQKGADKRQKPRYRGRDPARRDPVRHPRARAVRRKTSRPCPAAATLSSRRAPSGGGRRRGLAADRLQVPGRHLRRAARCL